ncbi:MAG TPA: BamA/TamA family outer membrane protein [Aliidongia sp.]|nr:BamA/TamA family outer membrane protein [Aliidongia sp.]
MPRGEGQARRGPVTLSRFILALAAFPLLALMLAPGAKAEVTYETSFTGAPEDLDSNLNDASQLVALVDKHPATEGALRRRAESDMDRLTAVLHAAGYYDAALSFDIDESKDPLAVTVKIVPGPIYHLAQVKITLANGELPPDVGPVTLPAALGLDLGAPATASPVIDAEPKIVKAYTDRGWPFAKVADRRVLVDQATKEMDVTYILDPGMQARFGSTKIAGLDWLDQRYVERRIGWAEGDLYDQSKVDTTRQTLVTSGLFGTVSVAPETKAVEPDGTVPMGVGLAERPLHSLGVGAAYDTTEGISGTLSWEDRNIFGQAEDVNVVAQGGTTTDHLIVNFRRPDIFADKLDLVSNLTLQSVMDPAYDAVQQTVRVGFENRLTPQLTGDVSIQAEHARLNEKIDYRVYTLVGIPISVRQDDTDDLLNPTRGYRAGAKLTPYLRALGSNESFVQAQINGSTYRKLSDDDTYVLALSGILGATGGASIDAIPKDHRFFTGGGGSVRGFGFQKGGPIDQFFNPVGGLSTFETSLELRAKVTDTIGVVPFFDAGSDYPTALPKLNAKLYMGVGIGLRYYTAIGPVRFDIATPLNPHSQGDSPVQIYVSLGQAF